MFDFIKNKRDRLDLVNKNLNSYLIVLRSILKILNNAGHTGQAGFIQKLIDLVNQQETNLFTKYINGIEMWGGAGAVWEVYIDNKEDAKLFDKEMLNLINLMDATKILGRGIKPIRRIYEKNLKNVI